MMNDEDKCEKRPSASSIEIDEKGLLKNRILRFNWKSTIHATPQDTPQDAPQVVDKEY